MDKTYNGGDSWSIPDAASSDREPHHQRPELTCSYPFERVAEAWERQAAGANAKIVVTVP